MRAQTIEQTIAGWTDEPEKAHGAPSVTARAEDAQALIQAGPFTWRADLPAPLGGTNQAPSPTALLLSALAGCAVVFVKDTLGPQLGMQINSVTATVQCESDARGLLGMDGVEPDLRNFTLDVGVDSSDGDGAVAELARVWEERCPIYLALRKPTDVAVRFATA
ncbi:MAG TPA: OsmC family protein [Actinomycetota bacterium]|nr:OsmC family protein [Actinomycetota bacterium]